MFPVRARISVLLIYLPNEYYNYKRWYTIHPHRAYLCSLNELYFLIFAISILNFLKPEQIHSKETTMRRKRSIFPKVCHHKTVIFWASCTRNQISVLDRRQMLGQTLGKMGLFQSIIVSSLLVFFWFEEIVSGTGV